MANLPISGFTNGAPAQAGDEFVIARALPTPSNFKLTTAQLATYMSTGLSSLTLGTQSTTQGTLILANTAVGAFPTTLQASNSASAAWTLTLPTTAGSNGFILTTNGSGVTSWTNPTSLGIDLDVGTTAITNGTAGRLLFEGTGNVLQESANLTWDNTNQSLGITSVGSGTGVTTSSPVLNLTQTWNAGAVTFTGLKFNAATGSNANSASGSLLLDLQLEGASKFSVRKSGTTYLGGSLFFGGTTTDGIPYYGGHLGLTNDGGSTWKIYWQGMGATATTMVSGAKFGWCSSATDAYNTNADTILTRAAAASLQLGAADAAAPVAQTLQVQSVVTGTTNTAGANFTIQGSQGTGNAAGGSIVFQVAPAGSSGTAQNAYSTALTIASDRSATFSSTVNFPANSTINTSGTFQAGGTGTPSCAIASTGIFLSNSTPLQWSSTNSWSGGSDVFLYRDAANTLALRNSTNAQTFNVYNTYTSSTNYETFKVDWITTANTCLIGTEKGSGGGTARNLSIISANDIYLNSVNGLIRLQFNGGSGAVLQFNDRSKILGNVDGDILLQNSTGSSFGLLQFGGTTSSFPALKRISSGNCLQVIAADNTASAGFIVGNQALATAATDGFLYVPTCAGTPTGTPTAQTGTAPIVVDTTNNKLYFYSGGAWRDAGP